MSVLKCECGSEETKIKKSNMHLGEYCKACDKWKRWIKQNNSAKTKEEYRVEALKNQPPTAKQIQYARKLGYTENIENKYHAMTIIEKLKGGEK